MITLYKQIYPEQCPALAKLGYQSIVNLRYDDECQHQPKSCELQSIATNHKLNYHHLPIDGEHLCVQTVERFAKLINTLPRPIMVFCGTGSRAKRVYQCAKISGLL